MLVYFQSKRRDGSCVDGRARNPPLHQRQLEQRRRGAHLAAKFVRPGAELPLLAGSPAPPRRGHLSPPRRPSDVEDRPDNVSQLSRRDRQGLPRFRRPATRARRLAVLAGGQQQHERGRCGRRDGDEDRAGLGCPVARERRGGPGQGFVPLGRRWLQGGREDHLQGSGVRVLAQGHRGGRVLRGIY